MWTNIRIARGRPAPALTVPRDTTGGAKEGGNDQAKMVTQAAAESCGDEKLKKLAHILKITVTPDGIRIDMGDDTDFSMFQLGTTVLTPMRCNCCVPRACSRMKAAT
jgi:hypothetical protein